MKQLLKFIAGVFAMAITLVISCKKELSCQNCKVINQPPVACAGADQTVTLPTSTVNLDGSCSADPDNNISSYVWTKIAGSSANIATPNAVQTQVTGLIQGSCQFELKVTDAGGLSSKDTVQITVKGTIAYTCGDTNRPHINEQLIPVGSGTLSDARTGGISVASGGNKIFFAGGSAISGGHSSTVDIYDITTQRWTTAKLSENRSKISTITAGNKVFFAGGEIGDGTCPTKTVDIYDLSTSQWSTSSLSIPGSSVVPALVGNKVLFAGGDGGLCGEWARTTTVDMYDLTTNNWTTASLSTVRRHGHAAVTLNNKVYISGGESWPANTFPGTPWFASNTVDIYDYATNSWSTSTLSEGKYGHGAAALNDKVFWAGGTTGSYPNLTASCNVDIKNVKTGEVSIQKLSSPGGGAAVIKNNQVIFYSRGDRFDLYDVATDKWSIGVLPAGFSGGAIISINSTIYIISYTGSAVKVWKLDF
jgi:N-acetylneuraminic acid mutarotase